MSLDEFGRDQSRLLNLQVVLQHAAAASLASPGPRTLGPDQNPRWLETKRDTLAAVETTQAISTATDVRQNYAQPAQEPFDTSIFPDANAINASILKRELAQECKRSIRLQLKELKERQKCVIKELQLTQLHTENQQLLSRDRVIKENDKQLEQLAEQMAKTELESHKREQLELLTRNNEKLNLLTIEGISRCHRRFCSTYESIAKLLLALDHETAQACANSNRELRELGQQFDALVSKIKNQNYEPSISTSVFTAEKYCRKIDELEGNFHKQLSEQERHQKQLIKAKQLAEEKEKQRLLEAEQQQKQQQERELKEVQKKLEMEAAQQKRTTNVLTSVTATTTVNLSNSISSSYVHPTRLLFYNDINTLYQAKVDAVKPLQTDETWKKYRTNCQRTINTPLNAITATSPQHLTSNFDKLYNFFAGQTVKTTDGSTITINDHPLARDYCILLMAKKFVSQTDTAISSNPQAAFPFASVINSFWKLLPDFGKIFLAYMYKESPYLVPYVIPQQPDQTPEQYLKTMGYRLSDKNELEKADMFLKRQTGIARLYAAIIITPSRKADGLSQCFGLEEAWRWLTHIMFVKPLPDICATMIMEMLQTLGYNLWRAYGKNFLKLLVYIQTIYIPQLSAYDEGGPKTRLEMLLSKFLRERQIPQAVGVLPPGFW